MSAIQVAIDADEIRMLSCQYLLSVALCLQLASFIMPIVRISPMSCVPFALPTLVSLVPDRSSLTLSQHSPSHNMTCHAQPSLGCPRHRRTGNSLSLSLWSSSDDLPRPFRRWLFPSYLAWAPFRSRSCKPVDLRCALTLVRLVEVLSRQSAS